MGRGGATYLSYTALVLLSAISPASAGLWTINIDESPAPSPEDGPPFSAHATRNRALLPYQIIGVVASYLGVVFILGTLLLTVGRRLRQRAQAMAERPTEMTKPMARYFEMSPVNQQKKGWGSLRSKKSTASSLRSGSEVGSPGGYSVMSVDQVVVQRDKDRANEQMARIFDALYEEEEQKMQPAVSTTETHNTNTTKPRSFSRPGRPELQRVQTAESVPYSPYSPTTPRSPYPIYPPDYPSTTSRPGLPENPRSPVATQSPQHIRGSSFGSNRTSNFATTDQAPSKQSMRKSIRNLKISAPIQRLRDDDNDDDARTPLSPKYYRDPGVPPQPPSATTLEGQGYPVTPGSTVTADFVGAYGAEVEGFDYVRDVPQAHPQRIQDTPEPHHDTPERRRGGKATNINTSLPFRQQYAAQRQPLSPTSGLHPPSAGPIVTRFVNVPQHNRLGAPLTGAATPYSPYMPSGFLTPVTPSIMSREQRKQKQKEERAIRGAITEEDQVADDKDLWSSGY